MNTLEFPLVDTRLVHYPSTSQSFDYFCVLLETIIIIHEHCSALECTSVRTVSGCSQILILSHALCS
jgi:hypothetical protein